MSGSAALIEPAIEELLRYGSPVEIATERFTRGLDSLLITVERWVGLPVETVGHSRDFGGNDLTGS